MPAAARVAPALLPGLVLFLAACRTGPPEDFRVDDALQLLAQGREEEGLAALEGIALRRTPEAPRALGELSMRVQQRGDSPEACERFRALAAKLPESPQAHYYHGVHCSRFEVEEARSAFDRALALAPGDVDTHVALARLCLLHGLVEEGVEVLSRAVEAGRVDSARVLLYLGKLHWRAGRSAEAAEALQRAVERDPRDAEALMELGKVLSAAGDDASAERALRQALAIDGGSATALYVLAQVLESLGRSAEAAEMRERFHSRQAYEEQLSMLRHLLVSNPTHPEVHLRIAALAEDSGARSLALRHYERAAELAPGNAAAREGLARLSSGGASAAP